MILRPGNNNCSQVTNAVLGKQVCQDAASGGRASQQLLLEWPRLALRFGRVKAALAAASQGTAREPASAELWRQRLVLESQHASFQVKLWIHYGRCIKIFLFSSLAVMPVPDASSAVFCASAM